MRPRVTLASERSGASVTRGRTGGGPQPFRSAPLEAEWPPRRIRIDRESLGVTGCCVIDVEIEVQLMRLAVGPVWRDVVRRELKTEAWCTVDVNRAPIVLPSTVPSRRPAQEVISAARSAVSNTMIWRRGFIERSNRNSPVASREGRSRG